MTDPTVADDAVDLPPLPNLVAQAEQEADTAVRDMVAALTADTDPDGGAPDLDMSALHRLAKLKAAQRRYKAMSEALGPVIAELEQECVDNVIPHRAPDGRWSTTVGDKVGYLSTTLWPKRRINEETGESYDAAALTAALLAEDVNHLVARTVNGQSLAAWVRELVTAWEQRCGEDGVRNSRGELVDAFGNALTDEEVLDPIAPELALPPQVRKVIEISASMKISFRAR